jgi:predicted transglutaminase-like cysteine proteinase
MSTKPWDEAILDVVKEAVREEEPEKLAKEALPVRIMELHDLWKSEPFQSSVERAQAASKILPKASKASGDDAPAPPVGKKRKVEARGGGGSDSSDSDSDGDLAKVYARGSVIPSNDANVELAKKVRSEVITTMRLLGRLKRWVNLAVPKIEDGNNFGVEVQDDVISNIAASEDAVMNVLDKLLEQGQSRAALASKIVKFPTIEGYQAGLKDLDTYHALQLRKYVADIRDTLILLHDKMDKNWEKVVAPKGADDGGSSMLMY